MARIALLSLWAMAIVLGGCDTPPHGLVESDILAQDEQFTLFRYADAPHLYAVRTTATTRSGTFTMEVVLDEAMVIQDSRIIAYPLPRGREILQSSFLDQFQKKTLTDPIRVGQDVHAVTGATMSSVATAQAVRRMLNFALQHKNRTVQ